MRRRAPEAPSVYAGLQDGELEGRQLRSATNNTAEGAFERAPDGEEKTTMRRTLFLALSLSVALTGAALGCDNITAPGTAPAPLTETSRASAMKIRLKSL